MKQFSNLKRAFLPCLFVLLTLPAWGQMQPVTKNFRKTPLKNVLKEVEAQTGLSIMYDTRELNLERPVTASFDRTPVSQVLREVLDRTVQYSIKDKMIVIYKASATPPPAAGTGKTLTGTVLDETGAPMVGAAVATPDGRRGTVTDSNGRYSLTLGAGDALISVSYLGYVTRQIVIGDRTEVDVNLVPDAKNTINEVVVIGYGTQSRRTLTSAVSKVSGADLEGVPVNSIGDALKGKVPGVRVSTANNQPGSDPVFLIRGGSSINQSNAPIIIVDGVRREMTGLNTNDIESIEILKDAASAGIYGASASNGVILVTTKKGNRAKGPQITFEAQAAWTSPATKFDLMDARDYVVTMRRALNDCPGYTYGQQVLTGANSAGIGNGDSSIWTTRYLQEGESVPRGWSSVVDPVDPSKIIVFQDNDQQSQWFDDSYWMQYYVGVNGGSDKVTYAASASYMKDGGIGINTDFSRFTFHGNTSFKITKSLTAGTTFDYSETSGNEIPSSGIGNYWTILGRGMFMPATHRDYLEDGQPGQGT